MKTALFIFLTYTLIQNNVYGSTTLGDSNDNTSIYLWGTNSVSSNIKDKSIKLTYLNSESDDKYSWGLALKGKAADGSSLLFEGSEATPETTVSIPIGKHWIFSTNPKVGEPGIISDDWLFFEAKYKSGEHQLFDKTLAFDKQLYKEKLNSKILSLSYNAIIDGVFLTGVSIEYGKENNYEDLSKISVKTTTTIGSEGNDIRISESSIDAREGKYVEFNQRKINMDFMYVPGMLRNRIGFDLFARHTSSSFKGSNTNYGIGIFVLDEKGPTRILAGVTYMHDDEEN
ncbi:MAG: hypothetical protein ABJJ97_16680, partial [Ekhidna sp.]